MAHLLMIESWVGGTGQILPAAIKALGHSYTFVTRKQAHYAVAPKTHPVLSHAEHILTTETNDIEQLIAFLRHQHTVLQFDGVITICDYYIDTVRHVAAALELPCPFPSQVQTIRNKGIMRDTLAEAGILNPAYQLVSTWADAQKAAETIGYPLVIKPTDLASSAHVRMIHTSEELQAGYDVLKQFPNNFRDQPRDTRILLEGYMQGPEVSVEACSYAGKTTIIGITDKGVTAAPYFIEDSHMFPANLTEAEQTTITEFVQQALKAVGFDQGISHTEVKLTPEGPRIVEINPRVGGNYIVELVKHVTGIDLLATTIELALGLEPELEQRATGITSAAIQFLIPPQGGLLKDIIGAEDLDQAANIKRWKLEPIARTQIAAPIDNACYLGHIVAVDSEGLQAREYATKAAAKFEWIFEEQLKEVSHD